MSDRLDTFVRDALARGATREQIREALTASGWPPAEVDAALGAWIDTAFGVPAPRRRVQTSAREAFLYLVMFATLYVAAFNVGAILFAGIERTFPDPAFHDRWSGTLRAIRGSTAAVIIALPVFLLVARYIEAVVRREPEKRGSGVRRWLTWLTLFLAAVVLIGNLVVVVTQVLSGELALRFVLKATTVFAIAGMVFGHYFSGMRRDETEPVPAARRPGWIARTAVAFASLVAVLGLWMSGTPGVAREVAFDERRSQDLNSIAAAVGAYALRYGDLPENLEVLARAGARAGELRDPQTGELYEYEVIGESQFRLCATFQHPGNADRLVSAPFENYWEHPAGRACFTVQAPPPRPERR